VINQAQAYRNEVIPRAEGEAARVREEAGAYVAQIVQRAKGDASRFSQQLAEYAKAPGVTRDRLYIDTMERVLQRSGKVLIDVESSQPLMYLPLDRMMRNANTQGSTGSTDGPSSSGETAQNSSSSGSSSSSSSRQLRMRETR
jgi:membrane protease subunit HflK